jgi:hypothetical protein
MNKTNATPDYSLTVQSKDTQFQTELKTIFEYLKNKVCTASMVAEATGIKQKNICRYKRDLEQHGLLKELYKTYCKTTGFKAWYLTTNSELFAKSNQTKLF